jgi:predicted alpha/beta-hydrolase family hydrolase
MGAPLIRKVSEAAADAGIWGLRFNFRYVDSKSEASRNFVDEVDDLLGGVRLARNECGSAPILIAGASMGARVCALASADPDVAAFIALGYPLHPRFRPEVRNPPEWPKIVKPALFVQGDHDPFCDLARLQEELIRLSEPHDLVVIRNAGHSFEPKGPKRDTFPEVWDAVRTWIEAKILDR